jgi:hypothetical protein
MKELIRKILKEHVLLIESGIRGIKELAKRYKKAKIYFHQDLDGVTTAIAMKNYLEQNGIEVVDAEVIQYGAKEFAIRKPELEDEARGEIMPVLVDFAHGKPMFVIHTDHHDTQAGAEDTKSTSFKSARSNVETISQVMSPKEIFPSDDILLISTVDSANFIEHDITPEMVMNYLFKYDKDKTLQRNKMLMGLVVNKLLLAYKNKPGFMEEIVLNAQPSLLSILNNIRKQAVKKGFATPEDMIQNQAKYIESRKDPEKVKTIGNIITQYGFGSTIKPGSYDRYTPFRNNPDADFIVTGMPMGMVQSSCNPFKKERALKGINLGEVKDEVLEKMSSELKSLKVSFGDIKKVSEFEAEYSSVGFTLRDMVAIYGSVPSFKVNGGERLFEILDYMSKKLYKTLSPKQKELFEKITVNGLDVIKANSGGHKCITNISGINFLYRKKSNDTETQNIPNELKPIANYEGSDRFVNDIKSKLLRFGSLSDKQKDAAFRQIAKEGLPTTYESNEKPEKTYVDLVKEIQNLFVDILQEKINQESETKELGEEWSEKYKRSIDCNNPKGFSQRAHCQGKKKRNLNEDGGIKISVSSDGIVNIWKLKKEGSNVGKVYRYKLVATYINTITRKEKEQDIKVKKIDIQTGEIIFVNPENNKEMVETIPQEIIKKILIDYTNETDIENIMSFQTSGVKVNISLKYYETKNIEIE